MITSGVLFLIAEQIGGVPSGPGPGGVRGISVRAGQFTQGFPGFVPYTGGCGTGDFTGPGMFRFGGNFICLKRIYLNLRGYFRTLASLGPGVISPG